MITRKEYYLVLIIALIFVVTLAPISIVNAATDTNRYTLGWVTENNTQFYAEVVTKEVWMTDVYQPLTVQLSADFGCNTEKMDNIMVDVKIVIVNRSYVVGGGPYVVSRDNPVETVVFNFFVNNSEIKLKEGESVSAAIYITAELTEVLACPFGPFKIPAYELYGSAWFYAYNITIIRPSNSKPSVSIVSPAPDVAVKGVVTIKASVSDTDSEIDAVEVKICDSPWYTMTREGSFYTYTWNSTTISDGIHEISVRARDKNGNVNNETLFTLVDNVEEQTDQETSTECSYIVKKCRTVRGIMYILSAIVLFLIALNIITMRFSKNPKKKQTR